MGFVGWVGLLSSSVASLSFSLSRSTSGDGVDEATGGASFVDSLSVSLGAAVLMSGSVGVCSVGSFDGGSAGWITGEEVGVAGTLGVSLNSSPCLTLETRLGRVGSRDGEDVGKSLSMSLLSDALSDCAGSGATAGGIVVGPMGLGSTAVVGGCLVSSAPD